MKWTLIFIFGSSLAETVLCWTYHYSNDKMNWSQARRWCQEHFTDMVVIQNQAENDYLVSFLPKRDSSPYFWIGITKKHKNETWTWIGNNSTWISNNSWAKNEPNNNHITEFCVEIYTNSGGNRGKWNDEKCDSLKSPVCYKTQCNATSCERGRCQETINSTSCLCERGFKGDRCQTAVECPALSNPENGYYTCSGGNHTFNTTCQLKCDPGFLVIGSPAVTCGDTGVWNSSRPSCSAVECPPLSNPDNGNNSCSGTNQTFNTTCRFKCDPGFLMIGSPAVICGHTGSWSGPRPTCSAVECSFLSNPENGHYTCSGGNHTFNTTCRFKCDPGFLVIGSRAVICGHSGSWSGPRPTCTSYKQALLAVAGCGAFTTFCCICFCCMKHRQRKKLTQVRQPEEASPTCDAQP